MNTSLPKATGVAVGVGEAATQSPNISLVSSDVALLKATVGDDGTGDKATQSMKTSQPKSGVILKAVNHDLETGASKIEAAKGKLAKKKVRFIQIQHYEFSIINSTIIIRYFC